MNLTNNFDKLKNKEDKTSEDKLFVRSCVEKYDKNGYGRKVSFVLLDGTRKFFNYAHLIDGIYYPEENSITLVFTTGSTSIKGKYLEKLFQMLELDLVRSVTCMDSRYLPTANSEEIFVTSIIFS